MAIPFNVHILTLLLFVSNLFYLTACNEPEVTETTSGINVSSESLVVSIGESKQVTASVFPYVEEGGGVTWTMEDLSIAALEELFKYTIAIGYFTMINFNSSINAGRLR